MMNRFLFLAACCLNGCSRPQTQTVFVLEPAAAWHVTYAGLGPLRAGMTVQEAGAGLHAALTRHPDVDSAACDVVNWPGAPDGVSVLIEQGHVRRVNVARGDISTEAGARIGDTEERIKRLYPGLVTVEPHAYTEGHYLIVKSALPADSALRIIFETDSDRVTVYRAGMLPQVRYIEGCS